MQKASKKRRKQTEEKHSKVKRKKNEEYKESQITTIYILGFKLYFARKLNLKKSCLYYFYTKFVYTKFHLQFLCVAGHLKHSNDTPNLNIHRHTNYNTIKIYINRLSTTTPQIFIAMDYLKRKKYLAKTFFTHTMKIAGSSTSEIFFELCIYQRYVQKLKKKLE